MRNECLTKEKHNKIRCYVLADDYRWHYLTNDILTFVQVVDSYLDLMEASEKENHYYIKNIFLTLDEYHQFLRDISNYNKNLKNPKEKKTRKHLKLI